MVYFLTQLAFLYFSLNNIWHSSVIGLTHILSHLFSGILFFNSFLWNMVKRKLQGSYRENLFFPVTRFHTWGIFCHICLVVSFFLFLILFIGIYYFFHFLNHLRVNCINQAALPLNISVCIFWEEGGPCITLVLLSHLENLALRCFCLMSSPFQSHRLF